MCVCVCVCASVRPPDSNLKTFGTVLEKQGRNLKWHAFMDPYS